MRQRFILPLLLILWLLAACNSGAPADPPGDAPQTTPTEAAVAKAAEEAADPPVAPTQAAEPAQVEPAVEPVQTLPDGRNDALDCRRTLLPTGENLPQHVDIREVSWSREGDLVEYTIRTSSSNLQRAINQLGDEDFVGAGLMFLDPAAGLSQVRDTGWLPDFMGNVSLNIVRDADSGLFSGLLFVVQEGEWVQVPGVRYPVTLTADAYKMVVPVDHLPAGAPGFAISIMFDAATQEVHCDVAGHDEEQLRNEQGEATRLLSAVSSGEMASLGEATGRLYLLKTPDSQ